MISTGAIASRIFIAWVPLHTQPCYERNSTGALASRIFPTTGGEKRGGESQAGGHDRSAEGDAGHCADTSPPRAQAVKHRRISSPKGLPQRGTAFATPLSTPKSKTNRGQWDEVPTKQNGGKAPGETVEPRPAKSVLLLFREAMIGIHSLVDRSGFLHSRVA